MAGYDFDSSFELSQLESESAGLSIFSASVLPKSPRIVLAGQNFTNGQPVQCTIIAMGQSVIVHSLGVFLYNFAVEFSMQFLVESCNGFLIAQDTMVAASVKRHNAIELRYVFEAG